MLESFATTFPLSFKTTNNSVRPSYSCFRRFWIWRLTRISNRSWSHNCLDVLLHFRYGLYIRNAVSSEGIRSFPKLKIQNFRLRRAFSGNALSIKKRLSSFFQGMLSQWRNSLSARGPKTGGKMRAGTRKSLSAADSLRRVINRKVTNNYTAKQGGS